MSAQERKEHVLTISTSTSHVIAATIALNIRFALWAALEVVHEQTEGCAIFQLCLVGFPLPQVIASGRRVRFSSAVEAERLSAHAHCVTANAAISVSHAVCT